MHVLLFSLIPMEELSLKKKKKMKRRKGKVEGSQNPLHNLIQSFV